MNKYDWKKSRKYAFVIYNNKMYKQEEHYQCCMTILSEFGYTIEELAGWFDGEMFDEIFGDELVVVGEVGIIDNKELFIIYNEDCLKPVREYLKSKNIIADIINISILESA